MRGLIVGILAVPSGRAASSSGSVAEYGRIETTIAPEVFDAVPAWLTERFA